MQVDVKEPYTHIASVEPHTAIDIEVTNPDEKEVATILLREADGILQINVLTLHNHKPVLVRVNNRTVKHVRTSSAGSQG